MEDLLVYMLHQGLPFALAELNFGRMGSGVEVDSAIRLDVDRLKDWEHWSEKGREYLGALSGKAKLHGLVKEYADTVAGFYQWFVLRQSELHRDSLERLEELEEKRREQWQKMRRIEDFLETAESTATEARKDRERLSKELERERERAERLEADLDRERSKGFWRRVFGR
jgi:DNA repair exonuclease SbcCD ATPase subunit